MNFLFIIPGGFIGAILGSFVHALASRSISNKSFLGRSKCPGCKHILGFFDLIPILSFLILKGRCRYCRKKIGFDYLLTEVFMGVLAGFLFFKSGAGLQAATVDSLSLAIFSLETLFKLLIIVVFAIIFLTDLKKTLIPDRITYPAIVLGFLFLSFITSLKIASLYFYLNNWVVGKYLLTLSDYFQRHVILISQPLWSGVLMAAALGLFFLILILLTKGKGMGGGDLKLGIFIGLVFGFPLSIIVLILAFVSGAAMGVLLLLSGNKKFGQTIPFGPFLALGGVVTLFWGSQILDWYLHLSF